MNGGPPLLRGSPLALAYLTRLSHSPVSLACLTRLSHSPVSLACIACLYRLPATLPSPRARAYNLTHARMPPFLSVQASGGTGDASATAHAMPRARRSMG